MNPKELKDAAEKFVLDFTKSQIGRHPALISKPDGEFSFLAGAEWGWKAREALAEEDERELVEAIRDSIARADDYGDSGLSAPIRKALAAYRSRKEKRG